MRAIWRTAATIELLLVVPATLFLGALFLRDVQPLMGTGHLVDWFARHVVLGLYVSLIAMPLVALVTGVGVMLRSWRSGGEFRRRAKRMSAVIRGNLASLLIAASTLMAGGILAVVAMHMITE